MQMNVSSCSRYWKFTIIFTFLPQKSQEIMLSGQSYPNRSWVYEEIFVSKVKLPINLISPFR